MTKAFDNITKLSSIVSVTDFGAAGNGSTDNTTPIQYAINHVFTRGGGEVYFPDGEYITQTITLKSGVTLRGQSRDRTILKLKDGTNNDLLYGEGANALFGSNTNAGISNFGIENFTLNGNRAGNTSGSCIAFYGRRFRIVNVDIHDAPHHGIRSDWYQFGEDRNGIESIFRDVSIDACGRHGFFFAGPHDSHLEHIVVIDPSQETSVTWDAINVSSYANGRWFNCHTWTRSGTTNRTRYGISVGNSGNEFVNCHFEGASTANMRVTAQRNRFVNCQWYAARGTKNVVINSSDNYLNGALLDEAAGAPGCVGITFGESGGDTVSANVVDVYIAGQSAGAFDFTNLDSENVIFARGVKNSGTTFVGNPGGTNVVSVTITGASGFQINKTAAASFLTATGTTQSDAYDTTAVQGNEICTFTTVASGTGARLPASLAGKRLVIKNRGANALLVYPPVGGVINALATNAAYSLAAGSAAWFICSETSNSRWETVLGA